jgi:hypothetical protein
MKTIVTIGVDLAENVFAVHDVDATGKPALVRPNVPHAKLLGLIASLPPCLIKHNHVKSLPQVVDSYGFYDLCISATYPHCFSSANPRWGLVCR